MKTFRSSKYHQGFNYQLKKVIRYPGSNAFTFIETVTGNKALFLEPQHKRKVELSKVTISREQAKLWGSIYEWRNNTELPIAKIYYIVIKEQINLITEMSVFGQYFPNTLDDFKNIHLMQMIYLIKQSLIGFQRLYSKFGGFEVSSKMIAINQNKKCKVWLNQNFQLNLPIQKQINQKLFLQNTVNLFSSYTQRNYLSKIFFIGIKNISKFVQAFKYIDRFAEENNIKIPYKLGQEPNKCDYKIKVLDVVNCPQHIQFQNSSRSSNRFSSISKKQMKVSDDNCLGKSTSTQNQAIKGIKHQNQTTKAASNLRNKIIGNSQRNNQASSHQSQQFNQEECYYHSNTPQYKPNKSIKIGKVFKSQINLDEEGHQIHTNEVKLKKFNSEYKQKKSNNSSKIQSLNIIEQIYEEKQEPILQSNSIQEQDSFAYTKQHNEQMLRRNGWVNNRLVISTMIDGMEQSIILGKQIQSANKAKLQKLELCGRYIKESMLLSQNVNDYQ